MGDDGTRKHSLFAKPKFGRNNRKKTAERHSDPETDKGFRETAHASDKPKFSKHSSGRSSESMRGEKHRFDPSNHTGNCARCGLRQNAAVHQ